MKDPTGLGRGPLTRWLPLRLQATTRQPPTTPYSVADNPSAERFALRIIFSAPRWTVPGAMMSILQQVGEALIPIVIGLAVDRALSTGNWSQLGVWLMVLAVVYVGLVLGSRFSQQLMVYAAQRVQHRLRATLSSAVLHADRGGGRPLDGGVVSTMTNDVMRAAAVGVGIHPIGEVVAILFIAVALLVIYWPLGLGVLIGAPIVVWLMGLMSREYARSTKRYQTLLARTVARATDLVAGYRVIKGVGAESEATRRYRAASQEALVGVRRNVGVLGRYQAGSGAISGGFGALVAGIAGVCAVNGAMTVGELIAAAGLAQALLPQMSMVTGNAVPAWAAAVASAGRILDALREAAPDQRAVSSEQHAAVASEQLASAQLASVSNRPPATSLSGDSPPRLDIDLSSIGRQLVVTPGELVGIQADDRTAALLATILLNGAELDADAVIRLDGVPTPELGVRRYREVVMCAPHHATLFGETVREALTTTPRSAASIRDALAAAACDDFVDDLDVSIGEDGLAVSGGQHQRLALARALARHAPILVLHDPTTAVDSITESLIARRLGSFRRGRTTLLITTSPVLLGVCDRVITANLDGADLEAATT